MMHSFTPQDVIELFFTPSKTTTLTLAQWSTFIFILRDANVLARFCFIVEKHNCFEQLPKQVQEHLSSAKIKANKQEKQAIFEAVTLDENLSSIQVKPVFLKGAAYSLRGDNVSQGRTYADIDVLVEKSQLQHVERHLSSFGWFTNTTDDYDDKYYRLWAHEIPPMQQGSRGTIADIHHNLLPPISGKAPDITLFTNDLYQDERGLYTLNSSAMVLHSIIHLFFNEEFDNGFRDLGDLHYLFTSEQNNEKFWLELLLLSQATNFEHELFYAVRYCVRITGTKFPDDFIEKINHIQMNSIQKKWADFIFESLLVPNHYHCATWKTKVAKSLALIRGHLLKMPIHVLIYHSSHKLIAQIKTLFSKS